MEIIAGTSDFYLEKETAAAIGKFDGVHIGHRRLLEEILSRKKDGLAACVFTFDPAPAVLFGTSDGKELTTREEKRLLFERMGVDILIEFPLTHATAAILAEDFVREVLAERMQVRFLAAGNDLSFGSRGAGNVELLRRMGTELDFTVEIIEKVCLEGAELFSVKKVCPEGVGSFTTCVPNESQVNREQSNHRLIVSSTCVREQVEAGRMELAERMLGMPYMVAGNVEPGKQLGRTLGFPTVNLLPGEKKLLPPNGVYFSRVRFQGKLYRAISNVGYKPTVTAERVMGLESYLYDFDQQIYGEPIEVYLLGFRRPEQQFESVEALRAQLQEDIAAGEAYSHRYSK